MGWHISTRVNEGFPREVQGRAFKKGEWDICWLRVMEETTEYCGIGEIRLIMSNWNMYDTLPTKMKVYRVFRPRDVTALDQLPTDVSWTNYLELVLKIPKYTSVHWDNICSDCSFVTA